MKRETMNMIKLWIQRPSRHLRSAMISGAILAVCTTIGAYPGLAQQSGQQTFPSAVEASQGLFQAVQHNDEQAIQNILGGPTDLTSCGDEAQDKLDRKLFVQKYQEMHRLGREADGTETLYIGAENWPFPVPLVEKNGAWRFDPDGGQKEVLFRRIGENELAAIAICRKFVAEKQHRPEGNTSTPEDNLPASLAAKAAGQPASNDPVLVNGYYFHVLAASPNGFALIAYPAAYRSSGVMTFIITSNDVVCERDLGAKTSALASAMTRFHKDATWHAADE